LKHVQAPFKGAKYEDLDDEARRRLDDSIIHATVLRQEYPSDSQDAVYSIFERLNTGGSPLQPQEIRVALYNGPFLRTISTLNEGANWRALYGPPSPRFKDHELILRVFALYERAGAYSRPVKGFLNEYLRDNRDRDEDDSERLVDVFNETTELIYEHLGQRAFRPVRPLNAAVLDSVMVGLMRRVDDDDDLDDGDALRRAYNGLIDSTDYATATTSSTAGEDSVKTRLALATDAFASL